MAQAKRDFEIGYLVDFELERYPLDAGWVVKLATGNLGGGSSTRGSLVDARTKQPRQFKTLDAAISALEQVGFKVEGLRRH